MLEEQKEHPGALCDLTDPVRKRVPHEMKTSRSMRTCVSRVVPADHEARSQVKDEEAAAERKKADPQNSKAWETLPADNARKERQNKTRDRS